MQVSEDFLPPRPRKICPLDNFSYEMISGMICPPLGRIVPPVKVSGVSLMLNVLVFFVCVCVYKLAILV